MIYVFLKIIKRLLSNLLLSQDWDGFNAKQVLLVLVNEDKKLDDMFNNYQ